MRRLPWPLLAAAFCSCVTPPRSLRERTDPAHGAIVMALSFKGSVFPYWRRHQAEELFFSRLRSDGSLDPQLVPANYRANDRIYLLDAPAGRYAPVAASYFTGRSRQLAKLEESLARKWAVEVKPGQIAFAGVAQILRVTDGWGTPTLNVLRRAASYLPPFRRAVIPVEFESPRLNVTRAAEIETLRLARVDLASTFWSEAVEERMLALGNPPPEVLEGLIRKNPVARRQAETFTYIDTLGWGEPLRVSGGLQWQAGKDSAWISIVFLPEQGPSGKPLNLLLRELREAGAPEDSHTLTDIAISSRSAYMGLYTSYIYPEASLVGSKVLVFKTQTVVVSTTGGAYKAQYRAEAGEFEHHRAAFERFLLYVGFAPPVKEKT